MLVFLFIFMLFAHIVDDYYLQGWLASAKQKSWWEENAPDNLYKNDYKMALFCHALSWSIMIHLPLIIFVLVNGANLFVWYIFFPIWIAVNLVIHAIVDHLKANVHAINLITDQLIHFGQIIMTFASFCLLYWRLK